MRKITKTLQNEILWELARNARENETKRDVTTESGVTCQQEVSRSPWKVSIVNKYQQLKMVSVLLYLMALHLSPGTLPEFHYQEQYLHLSPDRLVAKPISCHVQ